MPPPGTNPKGDWQIATDGYLEAMGERLIRGRGISRDDRSDTQLVALINEEMARRYWSGQDPIGGRFKIGGDPTRPFVTVVGIVGDVRHNELTGVVKEKFYVPHTQWHKSVGNRDPQHDARGEERRRSDGAGRRRCGRRSRSWIRTCRSPTFAR